jgi:hypothetical protein
VPGRRSATPPSRGGDDRWGVGLASVVTVWRPILVPCVITAALALGVPTASAGTEPPEQDPTASVPPTETAAPTTSTLPPGCEAPDPARATFVGDLTAKDTRTARFSIVRLRAGTLEGFEVSGLVDVDYFDDVRYLEIGERYIVGAGTDSITGRLVSTVRQPAPLFGGNQVVGVDDSDVDCPVFEDPVRTLMPDGGSVESGVLAPMFSDSGGIARALLLPAMWLFLGLVALAAIKNLLWASGREVKRMFRRREPMVEPAPRRSRRRPQQASAPRR